MIETSGQKTCFVIMPISDPPSYQSGHFQEVYEHLIRPACKDAGFTAVRADEVNQSSNIVLDVLRLLVDSDMAICDLSAKNGNCLYELGIRHALKKPVCLIRDDRTERIFDIKDIRDTEYDVNLRISKIEKQRKEIEKFIRLTYENRNDPNNSLLHLIERNTRGFASSVTAHRVDGVVAHPTNPIAAESNQRCGILARWGAKGFGFVEADGEDFYLARACLAQEDEPKIGSKIFFVPREEMSDDQSKRATCAFSLGAEVVATITWVNTGKKFAFAKTEDSHFNSQKIYVPLGGISDTVQQGMTVRFQIDENDEGPIGINLRVIDNPRTPLAHAFAAPN